MGNETELLTVGELVTRSANWLAGRGLESPRLDAELLLAKILNCDRLRLYMDWPKPLTELEISAYREFIRRRGQDREPVARITGTRNFYGRDFIVTPDTFVPRPETEGLVERAISCLEKSKATSDFRATVLEIGTGTGCIIVTLAAESGNHHFIATDVSPGAISTAKTNARRHEVEGRIEFRLGEDFAGWDGSLDMIVSNPPYICTAEIEELEPEVNVHDPMAALDGGVDGLDVVRRIELEARQRLNHGGWVLLEVGDEQGPACHQIFESRKYWNDIKIEKDLEGRDRYVLAQRSNSSAE